jgi:hypothetical protein
MTFYRITLPGFVVMSCVLGGPSEAQEGPADLRGKSVLAEFSERVSSKHYGIFENTYSERFYISERGRIFHRTVKSSSAARGNSVQELVSGDGNGVAPQWNSTGEIVRRWIGRNGRPLTQRIIFSRDGGLTCRMSVERNMMRGSSAVLSHSCRVVNGNVLAGG